MRIEQEDAREEFDRNVIVFAQYVSRAASDRVSRIARSTALSRFVFDEEPINAVAIAQSSLSAAEILNDNVPDRD